MTTQAQAREAIYARWKANSPVPESQYCFDNEKFDPNTVTDGNVWFRFVVRMEESNQETLGPIGGRKYIRRGTIFIQLFAPVDKGKALTDQYLPLARQIFEGVDFSGVRCDDVEVREVGQDGKWDLTNIESRFWFDEIR